MGLDLLNVTFVEILKYAFYIVVALLVLLIMITIHEFGHFIVGKKLGFKINEFAVGFGKVLLKHTTKDGILEVVTMIEATGIGIPGLISFIAFNMTTIPCFAAVASAKGELTSKKFKWTLVFWIVTSYIVSLMLYMVLSWWWTSFIFALLIALVITFICLNNKYKIFKVRKDKV